MNPNPFLSIQNLKVVLEKNTILKSFEMGIIHKEIVSLLGPSGCGKTTLLKTLAGFISLNEGKIMLYNKVIQNTKKSLPPFARKMSMVFQDYALFPHLNVMENINFSRNTSPHISRKSSLFKELVDRLALGDLLMKYPNEISGGQQQRVAVARSIISKPKLLLMDEPFANQDIELKEKMMEIVRKILKKEKITCLIATHEQNVALKFSDKIAVIQSQKIEQIDDPFNIFHKPRKYFVASFIGEGIFLKGKIKSQELVTSLGKFKKFSLIKDEKLSQQKILVADEVFFLIRSNEIIIDNQSAIKALVIEKYFKGENFIYKLELKTGEILISSMSYRYEYYINEKVGIKFHLEKEITCFH